MASAPAVSARLHRTLRSATGCSGASLALALAFACPAAAQTTSPDVPQVAVAPVDGDAATTAGSPRKEIVVVGGRTIVASLADVDPEQVYDEDRVASYGINSVGEFLDQLASDNGDTEPSVLVNGRPLNNRSDISDFPAEAIARVEALPRGAASRVGGVPGQRAYNVVLKTSVNSRTLTASYQRSTEGGWYSAKGEALMIYIKGQDRVTLALRAGKSDFLQESERSGFVPLSQSVPYADIGNVVPFSGTEIDPALSLAAGQIVAQAPVPAGNTNPSLRTFAALAGQINASNLSRYRSLRGRSRPYEANVSGNNTLTNWLSLTFTGRLGWTDDTRMNGLPSARYVLPASNAFTPFSRSVALAVNDPSRPLLNRSKSDTVGLSATFNANFGDWRATLTGRFDRRNLDYAYDFTSAIAGGFLTIDNATNPFAGGLGARIPVSTTTTWSRLASRELQADIDGPVLALPAGPLRVRAGVGGTWSSLDGANSVGTGDRRFRRHELEARGGLSIPLTGNSDGALRILGNTEVTIDGAKSDLGQYGTLGSLSLALNWQPVAWLRLSISQRNEERAPAAEFLAAPTLITANVRFFDPVTGNTVDVTTISGGAGNLDNERQRIRRLSLTATPWRAYNLQINADLLWTDLYNQFGGLPQPSPAVLAAFPDRFQRDGSGQLVLVDNRTVNFDRQHTAEMRTGIGFTIPLKKPVAAVLVRSGVSGPRRPVHRPILQFNGSFSHIFASTSTIRNALGPVDLLSGGVIGLGGGRQRDAVDGNVTLSDRGSGIRANLAWRGKSLLQIGTAAVPDELVLASYSKLDLRLFVDTANLFGPSKLTKGGRLTLSVDNVFNTRQLVRNSAGITPQSFQPIYREAVGRTVMLEFRKVL